MSSSTPTVSTALLVLALLLSASSARAEETAVPHITTVLYLGGFPGEDSEVRVAGLLGRLSPPVTSARMEHAADVEVIDGTPAALADRKALQRRDRNPEEALAYGMALLTALAAQDAAPDYLVVLGATGVVLTWDGATAVVEPLAGGAPEPSARVKQLRGSGGVLTAVGLSMALGGSAMAAIGQGQAADALAASEYRGPDGETYLDPAPWAVYEDNFEAGRDLNRGGWVLAAAGGTAAVAGLILLARGAHLNRLETALQATAVVTPDGAFVSLSGRF